MKVEINVNGVDLEVVGSYTKGYKGQLYIKNGEGYHDKPSIFEIDSVSVGGVDNITAFLSDDFIEYIKTLAVEEIEAD